MSDESGPSATISLPFAIGQVMWQAQHTPYQQTIPCPVCLGEKVVTVLIGQSETFAVDCQACGLGYEGPKGTITEYVFTPGTQPFVIGSVAGFDRGEWTVRAPDERVERFSSLYATEAEALAASVVTATEQLERNLQSRHHKRKNVKHATWTVQYHRSCIKDLERQLAWHHSRIAAGQIRKERVTL